MTVRLVVFATSGVVMSYEYKNVGSGRKLHFLTNSCKFPTQDAIGVQNFNFGPTFPQNEGLSAPNF